MTGMKRVLLGLLLVGGCAFNPELPEPPDVMGAWGDVFGAVDAPNLMLVEWEEHRHQADWMFIPPYATDRHYAHAMTHVWAIRQAKAIGLETLLTINTESGAWDMLNGDPHHTHSIWMDNGQPAALEKQALEYFQARR